MFYYFLVRIENEASEVNNQELDVNIDTYPITLNYNSTDLYENKTGFLPVNISVSNPNFVQLYSDQQSNIFNQPIEFNGKYKFIPYESPPGTFPVAGYIPQYMNDQTSNNWDLNININPTSSQKVLNLTENTSSEQTIYPPTGEYWNSIKYSVNVVKNYNLTDMYTGYKNNNNEIVRTSGNWNYSSGNITLNLTNSNQWCVIKIEGNNKYTLIFIDKWKSDEASNNWNVQGPCYYTNFTLDGGGNYYRTAFFIGVKEIFGYDWWTYTSSKDSTIYNFYHLEDCNIIDDRE